MISRFKNALVGLYRRLRPVQLAVPEPAQMERIHEMLEFLREDARHWRW